MKKAPLAPIIPHNMSIHNDKRTDNYYWLNNRENPAVIEYLNLENEYTKQGLADTEDLQSQLYDEIVGRIKQKDSSVPFLLDGHYYQTNYEEKKDYPVYLRSRGKELTEMEEILDTNILAEGKNYYQVGGLEITKDDSIIAYADDETGRRIYTIRFRKRITNQISDYTIENTSGNFFWADDSNWLFYVEKDPETLRPYWIRKWSLLNPEKPPVSVFKEEDETYYVSLSKSASGRYLIINSDSTLTTEINYIDLHDPDLTCKTFQERERGHEYEVEHHQNLFYIRTNIDGRNFSLKTCTENITDKSNWKTIIPHDEKIMIQSFATIKNKLIIHQRNDAQTEIRIHSDSDNYLISFNEEVYVIQLGTNMDPDSDFVRLVYTSLTTPTTVYDYYFDSKSLVLKKQEEIVGGYDASQYSCKRLWATGRDGEKIPISLVYKNTSFNIEKNPLLLYGYGSYGHSIDPVFGLSRLSLLDRGFVFAIAHIRGGEDRGRWWYENGRLLKKMNSFYDFIDCAKYLKENKYCLPDKLYAMGGSAGGLLMGAVVNMEPKLWAGVVAAVPFVDVLTTMLDETIPLTTGEYDEWGNPNDPVYYNYMKQYSPYDNVEKKDYPPMLVTTGLHDSQVQYWEPAKWVAKLRTHKTDSNELYLHTNMDAGHGGASGRFKRFKEIALDYAFLLRNEMGVKGER